MTMTAYTINQAGMTAHSTMLNRLANLNLDNETVQENRRTPCEGEINNMASQHRETYSYFSADGSERTIRLNGRSKKETDAKFQQFILSGATTARTPTLREFVDAVFRPHFMNGLAPTTIESYEQFLSLNILPFMGDRPMNEIDVVTIQSFMMWMATASQRGRKNDLNKQTIARVCGLVSRIYAIAVDLKIVADNPVKHKILRNPGKPGGHHRAVDDRIVDRVKRQIPHLPKEQQRLYMGLLVYTGMRKSELLGLRWEHVHLEEGYAEVVEGVTYAGQNKETKVGDTKTETSTRTVILPKPLVSILSTCKNRKGYVIHGRDAEKPVCCSTQKRLYESAFEALGIKGLYNNHDWRSTFGTQLKEQGVTSAVVADLLGHADTRMVETVYARTRHQGIMKQANIIEKINENYERIMV